MYFKKIDWPPVPSELIADMEQVVKTDNEFISPMFGPSGVSIGQTLP